MTGDAAEISRSDRVRSFEPPPAGFDPGTASADALSRYGLPRRPDPEREPYLAERWASVFGRPLSIVAAELASEPLPFRGRQDTTLTSYGVDGWAGVGRAIARLGSSQGGGPPPAGSYFAPATFVSAEWEVPQVMGDVADMDKYLSIVDLGRAGRVPRSRRRSGGTAAGANPARRCGGRARRERVPMDGMGRVVGLGIRGSASDGDQHPGAVRRHRERCHLCQPAAFRDCVPGEPLPCPCDERRGSRTGGGAEVFPLSGNNGGVDR
jgi:hypothetical protein